jgi:hypothetical protein
LLTGLQVDEVVQQAQRCAQAFAGLVELTRKHKTRNQLLGTALKYGGGFIDAMIKANNFWYAYYIAAGRPFQLLVKTMQKGTKIMQVRWGCRMERRDLHADVGGLWTRPWLKAEQGLPLSGAGSTRHSAGTPERAQ